VIRFTTNIFHDFYRMRYRREKFNLIINYK
jgi:hypothetical protein